MFNIKAIVFDIDGTAVANHMDAMPSQRLVAAVRAAQPDVTLIPATGRPYAYAKDVFDALGITGPAVTSGGANVITADTGKVTRRSTIPPAALAPILASVAGMSYNVVIEDEPKDTVRTGGVIQDSMDIIFIENVAVNDAPTIQERLIAIPGISASPVVAWGTGITFTITAADATKEHAIASVLEELGILRDHVAGVGDGDNDLHLFAAVGHRIAMGNATPALKAAADEITDSVDHDGLAKIIERYTRG